MVNSCLVCDRDEVEAKEDTSATLTSCPRCLKIVCTDCLEESIDDCLGSKSLPWIRRS